MLAGRSRFHSRPILISFPRSGGRRAPRPCLEIACRLMDNFKRDFDVSFGGGSGRSTT